MQVKSKRILVLGGTGFIGSYVVRSLTAAGHVVTIFHRGQTVSDQPSISPEVHHIYGDQAHLAEHIDAFRQFQPDVLLNMIAYTLRQAETLVSVGREIVDRLIVISSVDVYRARDRFCLTDPGSPDPTPLTEESSLRDRLFPYVELRPEPNSEAYATTYDKILVERTVMAAPELSATVLRLPMVYGPDDAQHRWYDYIKRMDDQRPHIFNVPTWRSPVRHVGTLKMLPKRSLYASCRTLRQGVFITLENRKILPRPSGSIGLAALPVGMARSSCCQTSSFPYHSSISTIRGRTGRSIHLGYGRNWVISNQLLRQLRCFVP